ncbi:MAG: GDSL family lipase [Clostridia bacterium]|nr:GDSL family lipase [Clostridia bacterium]
MKKLFRAIRILFLFCVLVGLSTGLYFYITSDEEEYYFVSPFKESEYVEYNPTEDNVKAIGRTYYENGVRYLSHSGSGVEFRFKGDYAIVKIIGDAVETQSENHYARFAIYKNAQLIADETVSRPEKTFRIESDSNDEQTIITVIKLSEAKRSAFGVGTIGVFSDRKIMPTADKELKIEFIGDSITCGYGIDEADPDGNFSTSTENFTKTYAYLTAQNLNADYSVVAFSGYGVISGFTSNGIRNEEATVGQYYDESVFLSYGRAMPWYFPDFISDIVVINLGTNDASYCSGSYQRRQMFISEYVSLLRTVRSYNPQAHILCILGDMNNYLYSSIEQAVEQYKSETADMAVEAMTVDYRMDINDIVIDGHPGYMSNIYAAGVLSEKINSLLPTVN